MTNDAEKEALAFDLMQIGLFAGLAAWSAPWQRSWLSIGMLERRSQVQEINKMVAEREAEYKGKPSIAFPAHGWLNDLLVQTKPGFMESAFLATEIMHIADSMSEDMHVASGLKKAEDIENRMLVEPLYRESIETFSEYMPEGLTDTERDLYKGQRDLLIQSFNMALSAHLLLSGRLSESVQVYPAFASNPLLGLSGIVERVMKSTTDIVSYVNKEDPVLTSAGNVQTANEIDRTEIDLNESNAKHVIGTANDDFLSHKPRMQILEKYAHALSLLGLSDTKLPDNLEPHLEKAARRYLDTPYSVPVIGGLFFAADAILSLRDYSLARVYLLLDAKVRELENENTQQYGFSKYLNEFIHSFTLAKALTQLGKTEEAEEIVEEWAKSAESYESPQDITGRTLGSLLVTRVLACYALLLDLGGKGAESSTWWQKVLTRSECLSATCELCADRLEVKDSANVKKLLNRLKNHSLKDDKTNDVIFYWWILEQVKSDAAEAVFKEAEGREDFINSLSDFASMELLSQRHECAFAEQIVKTIEEAASESTDAAAYKYELIGVYLRLALEYQQLDQADKAEENYKKGLQLMDSIANTTLETDPRKLMKLTYLRSEFAREHSLFLKQITANVLHGIE